MRPLVTFASSSLMLLLTLPATLDAQTIVPERGTSAVLPTAPWPRPIFVVPTFDRDPAKEQRSKAQIVTGQDWPVVGRVSVRANLPPVELAGPRFGFTFLSDGVVTKLRNDHDIDVGSPVTQFGWQFEKRLNRREDPLTAMTEWVVLVGGLERGVALPSVSWMVGLRTRSGVEFGVGPNITPVGVALAFAAGATFSSGSLNFPVTLAVVPSKSGVRVSLLTGFSVRR